MRRSGHPNSGLWPFQRQSRPSAASLFQVDAAAPEADLAATVQIQRARTCQADPRVAKFDPRATVERCDHRPPRLVQGNRGAAPDQPLPLAIPDHAALHPALPVQTAPNQRKIRLPP